MIKDSFNSKLRSHVKEHLSPASCADGKCNKCDKCFVTSIYDSFKTLLNQNCLQVGSYPRYTAIRPLHDLDILYILGNWNEQDHAPQSILGQLHDRIDKEYSNPTNYRIETSLQSHSVTVIFRDDDQEIFSVDMVPAYIFSKNEFNDDTYKVPEITHKKHGKNRAQYFEELINENREMGWLVSDPRGYIEIAKRVNNANDDFRKTVKFIKAWKNSCKEKYENFKLKSFHIEQVVTKYFQDKSDSDIFEAIFAFFVALPNTIYSPRIEDRADSSRYIDEYLNDLTADQRSKIIQARDCFLIKLENLSESDSIDELLDACFYERFSNVEEYLFDSNIPTLTDEDYSFKIYGEVQVRNGSFRKYILDKLGIIKIDRKIKFRIRSPSPSVDLVKWKVKNDNKSKEPRGEITDHQTKNDPEYTKYRGNHFVECYAIKNNVCVAKARQDVKLNGE